MASHPLREFASSTKREVPILTKMSGHSPETFKLDQVLQQVKSADTYPSD
jgi:hypothetical protein